MTSSTASSATAAKAGSPRAGWAGAARGCLACSLETTSVVLSKSGGDTRAAQARESSPSAAKAQHRACLAACAASSSSSRGRRRRGPGKSPQSSSRSPASHLAQRRWVNCAAWRRCRRPPRGAGWSTALGSLQGVVACHLPKAKRLAQLWGHAGGLGRGQRRRLQWTAQAVPGLRQGLARQLGELLADSVGAHH